MKILEIIGGAALVLGFLMHAFDLPFSSVLMLIGVCVLSLIYFYLGWALFNDIGFRGIFKKSSYKDIKAWNILFPILLGIALSSALIGVIFRIFFWPNWELQIYFGIVGTFLLLAIALYVKRTRYAQMMKNGIKRMIPIGLFALAILFISNEWFLTIQYPDNPDYVKAEAAFLEDPTNEELRQKAQEEWLRMEEELEELDSYE